jgi:conjugative relaxase-like TrwC/TraI family protein
MLTIRAMSNGRGYAANHLAHSDYYAEGQRVVGYWQGRGAEQLGLGGEVTEDQFEAIRQGLDPATGEPLRPRQSADRLSVDGEIQSRGRHLYDFTLSAPKSVSVMAALGEDDRLVRAHQSAVEAALQELEASAAARVRMAGANENRLTGNLVLAVYHHDTSRELDPQLHTHAVAGNLTYDGTEGRWKALQASDIYAQRAYLTEVYRNTLAHQVRALGYDIDDRHDARGRDLGFEIRGVSQDLMRTYSQRSQQRDQAIEAFTEKRGRPPTDNEVAILVRESRPDKLIEISTAEVKQRQLERLTPEETVSLTELRQQALEAARERERPGVEPAAPRPAVCGTASVRTAIGRPGSRGPHRNAATGPRADCAGGRQGRIESGGVLGSHPPRRPSGRDARESRSRAADDRRHQPWYRRLRSARRRSCVPGVRSPAA